MDIPKDVLKIAIKMVQDNFVSKDKKAASNEKPMIEAEGKSITWLGQNFECILCLSKCHIYAFQQITISYSCLTKFSSLY